MAPLMQSSLFNNGDEHFTHPPSYKLLSNMFVDHINIVIASQIFEERQGLH
jgi:hypothetical protein